LEEGEPSNLTILLSYSISEMPPNNGPIKLEEIKDRKLLKFGQNAT